ncbi:MAG: hypothetical protein OXM55_06610 [Bdellovibrionales bacterium]|nr:hypothetical protein [Bdellovibrionales bacterium]
MKKLIIINLIFIAFSLISCKDNKSSTSPGVGEPQTGSDGPNEPTTPDTQSEYIYTITNKLSYKPAIGTEDNFNLIQVSSGSVSMTLDSDDCVKLAKSQFNNLKIIWPDSIIICDNSNEQYKCPVPDHYTIQPNTRLIMKYQWNAPDVEKASKNTSNCKYLSKKGSEQMGGKKTDCDPSDDLDCPTVSKKRMGTDCDPSDDLDCPTTSSQKSGGE